MTSAGKKPESPKRSPGKNRATSDLMLEKSKSTNLTAFNSTGRNKLDFSVSDSFNMRKTPEINMFKSSLGLSKKNENKEEIRDSVLSE